MIYRRDGDDITRAAVFDADAAALPGFAQAAVLRVLTRACANLYPETLTSAFFSACVSGGGFKPLISAEYSSPGNLLPDGAPWG